ncbi:MAG: TIR domain-containing protein [Sinimarinibacterium flocculans]|uniref:TIR domain-containing protein n=1 Tax=Sinimarinibacterium flocculans TaxID=985250 RepID=UPI003C662F98
MTQGRYWAFISYSHADERVATWLHKALETYRLPKKLVGTAQGGVEVPSRLFPVFRDRDELPSSDSLGAKISDALTRAESLIVIASRQSAASHWVNEEIRTFKALGKGRRVFCVIADGEPFASEKGEPAEECFAPALRRQVGVDGQLTDERAEPIAADIRPGKDGRRDALLKLVAGVLDIGLDVLKQRDAHRRQRRLTAIAAAAVAASMFTTGLSFFAIQSRNEAQAQRRLAEARQTQAEGLIQFLLGDLRKKLEPIGKLDILDAVGEQAMAYFGQVAPEQLSDTELAARAQALRQIGDVRVQQGKLADASPAFEEALRLDEELVLRHPGDRQAIFNIAQSEFYIGYDHFERGEFEYTLPWFERYLASARKLVQLDPTNVESQLELAYAHNNMAAYFERTDQHEQMLRALDEATKAYLHLIDRNPNGSRFERSLVGALSWRCRGLRELLRLDESRRVIDEAIERQTDIVSTSDGEPVARYDLALLFNQKAVTALAAGEVAVMRDAAEAAVGQFEFLHRADPANHQWQKYQFVALQFEAIAAMLGGRSLPTRTPTEQLASCDRLRRQAPEDGQLAGVCMRNALVVAGVGLVQRDAPVVEAALRAAKELLEVLAGAERGRLEIDLRLLQFEQSASTERRERVVAALESSDARSPLEHAGRELRERWLALLLDRTARCKARTEWEQAGVGDENYFLFLARRCDGGPQPLAEGPASRPRSV